MIQFLPLVLLGITYEPLSMPMLDNETLRQLGTYDEAIQKLPGHSAMQYFLPDTRTFTKLVPDEFKSFGNGLVKEVFGGKVNPIEWRGYVSRNKWVSNKSQSFLVATIYGSTVVKSQEVKIFINNAGFWIFVEGACIPITASPEERQDKFVEIMLELTTYNRDRERYQLYDPNIGPGKVFGEVHGSVVITTERGDKSPKLTDEKWWAYTPCLSSSHFAAFEIEYTGWQEKVFGPRFIDKLFKAPDSDISPLDAKYWKLAVGGKG